jgi:CheY-like chemotaxis protein
MKVLIVDDEIAMRDTLRDVLEDEGFAVEVASNGREALDQLSKVGHVCAIILDLIMPEMSGQELLEAMGAEARLASIPVVIVTSDPTHAPAGRLTFRKPLRLDKIVDTVSKLCRRVADVGGDQEGAAR